MKVVTTCHKQGFDRYGFRWVEGVGNWPDSEFCFYTEGFDLKTVVSKRTEDLDRLRQFKWKYRDFRPPDYRFDVVRFSNKVFAAYDAFYDYKGIGVWLDADCVTYRKIPEGLIEGSLEGKYLALLKRKAIYTETGLWIMDCSHPFHKDFLDTWVRWFETDSFKTLYQWHDCTTLDATVRMFEKAGKIETTSLSGKHEGDSHPLSKIELGRYIDHCKGPRKDKGISPENRFRQ